MEVISQSFLPSLEGLTRNEVGSVVLSHIIRFATSAPAPEHARDIVVLVNRANNLITFLGGRPINAEPTSERLLPASKASVEAMPVVKVLDEAIDCSICLLDFEIDEKAKEMPCKHRFHSICIDKWLGINGSCPICRYQMPVDEQCEQKDDESGENERGDDGDSDMFVFHAVIRPNAVDMTISVSEVPRHAYDVLIGVGDGDLSGARDGVVSEARDGDGSEARDGGDDDESEVRDNNESEAQDMVIDNN